MAQQRPRHPSLAIPRLLRSRRLDTPLLPLRPAAVVTLLLALLVLLAGPPGPTHPGGHEGRRLGLVAAAAMPPSDDEGPGPIMPLPMDGDPDAKGLKGNATAGPSELNALI